MSTSPAHNSGKDHLLLCCWRFLWLASGDAKLKQKRRKQKVDRQNTTGNSRLFSISNSFFDVASVYLQVQFCSQLAELNLLIQLSRVKSWWPFRPAGEETVQPKQ